MAKVRTATGQVIDFDLMRIQQEIAEQQAQPKKNTTRDLGGLTAEKLGMGLPAKPAVATEQVVEQPLPVGLVSDTADVKRKLNKPE